MTIGISYEGSPEDFDTADALPGVHSGWATKTETVKDGDNDKQVLSAERTFAPGSELPHSYAGGDDPHADSCLEFPTTVTVVEEPDATYYYFRRVYPPRRWSYVEYWKDVIFDDEVKKLADKPAEELTKEDRLKLAQAFAAAEAYQQTEFGHTALKACAPDLDPAHWLMARRALLSCYQEGDRVEAVVEQCEALGENERDACFADQSERLLADARTAMLESLRQDAEFHPFQIAAFERAYDRAVTDHAITDEVGGHAFVVTVEMPGTIIAHNSDEEAFGMGAKPIEWKFDGRAFSRSIARVDGRVEGGERCHERHRGCNRWQRPLIPAVPDRTLPATRLIPATSDSSPTRARCMAGPTAFWGRHHDALDVVQDVFVRWARQCTRRVPQYPRGWLRRVTLNRAIDLRRNHRWNENPLGAAGRDTTAPNNRDGDGARIDQALLREDIALALDGLSGIQRGVLVAKVYDDMTFAQIAEELAVAVSTVKTHYLRAVRAVRDRLQPRWSREDES